MIVLPARISWFMTETDATFFTTLPNKTTTAHTIMINKLPPKKWQKQVTEKTFQEMYINVGMANCEKQPKQERDDIRFTHTAIPTSFYPSPPCGPTQYPHADYLSIHHHQRNPQTDSITVKLNNCTTCTNTIIQSPCSVTIVMAPSSQNNNQKSLTLQSNASAKQPTATSEPNL